ncbi:MAG: hypothetical protein NTV86_18325 [Planctomycetota bacterium]|nr:hypothetical protein [Planctomycetota bacterium]
MTDPSGSVTMVLDDAKEVMDHFIYSPTGEIHSVNAVWNTLDATGDSSGFTGIVGQLYKGRMSFGNHIQTDGRALYSALTGNLVTPSPDIGRNRVTAYNGPRLSLRGQ